MVQVRRINFYSERPIRKTGLLSDAEVPSPPEVFQCKCTVILHSVKLVDLNGD